MECQRLKSWFVVYVIISASFFAGRACGYAGGGGTAEDPYRIADANTLILVGSMRADQDKHFLLIADIDLSGVVLADAVIPRFSGTFDGDGRCIHNLTITGTSRLGLFGEIASTAHIRNLGVVDVNVVGSSFAVGGLAGISAGVVSNCFSTGAVAGRSDVGGLVGRNDHGSIINCHSNGSVSGNVCVGGLAGENYGSISNCYASGTVTGTERDVGGLTGYSRTGIANSLWDKEDSDVIAGDSTGLSTGEMQDPNTFLNAGWDFVGERANGTSEVWMMPVGGGYPVLSIFHRYRPPSLKGRGTMDDPYLIASAEELGAVVWHNPRASYRLATNIDLSGIRWSTAVIPVFSGVFDGNDLAVGNLTIAGGDCVGLFGMLEFDGQVRDLGVVDANVSSSGNYAGGLLGRNAGTVIGCHTTGGIAAGSYVGGLLGSNDGSVIECYSTCSVASISRAGGLVGYQSGRVIKSHSSGAITGRAFVGGLLGVSYLGGVIEDCYSAGKVEGKINVGGLLGYGDLDYVSGSYSMGTTTGLSYVGGLVGGCAISVIEDCYSTSIVSGDSCVGGLAGSAWAFIVRCYSTGPATASKSCGALLGCNDHSEVGNSFWDSETSGCAGSQEGVGLPTMQMKQQASFAGWDFDNVWSICEGKDYPHLRWENVKCDE